MPIVRGYEFAKVSRLISREKDILLGANRTAGLIIGGGCALSIEPPIMSRFELIGRNKISRSIIVRAEWSDAENSTRSIFFLVVIFANIWGIVFFFFVYPLF